jgi:hypothetical protein
MILKFVNEAMNQIINKKTKNTSLYEKLNIFL